MRFTSFSQKILKSVCLNGLGLGLVLELVGLRLGLWLGPIKVGVRAVRVRAYKC